VLALQVKVCFFHHQRSWPHFGAQVFSFCGMFLYYLKYVLVAITVDENSGETLQGWHHLAAGLFRCRSPSSSPIAGWRWRRNRPLRRSTSRNYSVNSDGVGDQLYLSLSLNGRKCISEKIGMCVSSVK
jgi:hypothetical protein